MVAWLHSCLSLFLLVIVELIASFVYISLAPTGSKSVMCQHANVNKTSRCTFWCKAHLTGVIATLALYGRRQQHQQPVTSLRSWLCSLIRMMREIHQGDWYGTWNCVVVARECTHIAMALRASANERKYCQAVRYH